MTIPPDILLVEDDQVDQIQTHRMLKKTFGASLSLDWISDATEAPAAIQARSHDVYIIDHNLGPCTGLDLIEEAGGAAHPGVFLLLTGQDSVEIDQAAMKCGAADYLIKGEMTAPLLARAIRYAMKHKENQQHLSFLAEHDALTGLANRAAFQTQLANAIENAKRSESMVALLLLDLDHFKDVNDTLGHPVGDLLIEEAAKRLLACTRTTDTVARLGGDEFAIIATNLLLTEDIVTLIDKLTDHLSQDFHLDGHRVSTSASTGVTIFPMDSNSPDNILKHADLALYQAKRTARGSHFFYDAELNERARTRKDLESELRNARENQELSLHFQPKICIASGRLIGVEALMRWNNPARGMIPPDQFIPIAESSGLISELGEWAIWEACRQSTAWRASSLPRIPIAVNVSTVQFRHADFAGTLEQAIASYQIDPSCIELEITETTIMDRVDVMTEVLQQLNRLGFCVAIDDFGTGHSSLALLNKLSVDTLKIDRSFVDDVIEDPNSTTIAKAIISLAKSLNMRTIAEGVETEAQFRFLRDQGCDEAQGYFFSRPIPADELISWYQRFAAGAQRGERRLASA